jgi:preprotein translocase subunit YajC
MIDTAWAQTGPGGGAAPMLVQILPLVFVFAILYLLIIRPQQQKQRDHSTLLANLKRNDEVVTTGGLYGLVVSLTDQIVTLEIAPNVRVRVQRQQVAGLANPARKDRADSGEKDKKDKEK